MLNLELINLMTGIILMFTKETNDGKKPKNKLKKTNKSVKINPKPKDAPSNLT